MRKLLLITLVLCAGVFVHAQNENKISKETGNTIEVLRGDDKTTVLQLRVSQYGFDEVETPRGPAKLIHTPNGSSMLQKGSPDVPKFTASLLIPDLSEMEVIVLFSAYKEYKDIDIAPSKGNLYRNTDPESVPYEYGDIYHTNDFFPSTLASLDEPYIIRDFCGQALHLYPFQYNPATQTLRVYTDIVVEVREKSPLRATNPFYRTTPLQSIVREFKHIYERHFINFDNISSAKYTPVEEYGRMLVISHGPYMGTMQPFVDWKNTIGIPTEIVDVSTIGGTNPSQVKSYIQNYYDTTNLAFILLVGDNMHIAPFPNSTPGITGPSDNAYAYLEGGDRYPDALIGRFSAESITHVETQVNRTIAYERADNLSTGWLNVSMGVARNEGAGMGHHGESDCEHMDLIRTRLLTYDYVTVHQDYDYNCTGVPNTNATQISNRINAGVGMINYCNHGSAHSWSVANYSSTHVNALTNTNKWPFIWSVACVNGEFVNQTCFAEVWLRATHNEEPTGALAALMSTINQSWLPPMDAQDEFNDILIEAYPNNIKRTFGGISFNGMYLMNDINGPAGYEMTDTWNLFGDPSVVVRTDDPATMAVTHPASIMIQETSITVNCNVEDAYVALSVNGSIIGTGTISGGSATISFAQLPSADSIKVAVTAFNHIPYLDKIEVVDFLYNLDAGITSIISPESHYICDNISVTPKVVLRNSGLNPLNNVVVNYRINSGTVNQYNWSGSLQSLETDTITLPVITLQQGTHTYEAYTSDPNGGTDQNPANDSRSVTFLVENLTLSADFTADITDFCNTPAKVNFTNLSQNGLQYFWDFGDGHTSTQNNPSHVYDSLGQYTVSLTADAGLCGQEVKTETAYISVGLEFPQVTSGQSCGAGSITLEAIGQGDIKWYSDMSATNLVHTGSTFVTPVLSSTTSYYVRGEITHTPQYGGRTDSIGPGGYFGNMQHQHYLIFDAYTPFKLISVKVYAGSTGSRTISLRDSYGDIIQSETVNIPAGESRVTLNFDVPVGTDLRLQGDGNPNLFRNNNNAATFPYTTPGLFSITETSASLPPYNVAGNYYYFYDWEAKEEDCFSAIQTANAIILHNPQAAFSHSVNGTIAHFNNNSQHGTSYLWDFGDGNTSTDVHPTHVYSTFGSYDVLLNVINDCGTDTVSAIVTTSIAAPMADFYANNIVVSVGDYVNFYDISANVPNDWHWIFEEGYPSSSNLQTPTIQYNTEGVFYVTLIATNDFGADYSHKPSYITVLATNIDAHENNKNALVLHPNPTDLGRINYQLNMQEAGSVSINIYNALGQLAKRVVDNKHLEQGSHNGDINVHHLSSGVYYITIKSTAFNITQKVIITH